MHLTVGSLVRLYPGWWRRRYGDEMRALLEAAPVSRRARLDLVRGSLDAWLHPPTRSLIPAIAALMGGGLWTVVAAAIAFQPVPPDWPGYLFDVIALALASAGVLLVATIGLSLRVGDTGGRAMRLAVGVSVVGSVAWIAALSATAAGLADGPTLAIAQTIAMVGTALVGVVLLRAGEDRIGPLVMLGSIAMLIPWTVMWLVFGAAWTAIGIILVTERVALSEVRG